MSLWQPRHSDKGTTVRILICYEIPRQGGGPIITGHAYVSVERFSEVEIEARLGECETIAKNEYESLYPDAREMWGKPQLRCVVKLDE
jgi:hypothetical protein